jgi:predicted O-methyltransferase YrrM
LALRPLRALRANKIAAERAQAKLERERKKSAAKIARLTTEVEQLRSSYYLVGARKKVDLREIDGFSAIAHATIESGRTGMSYDRLYTLWQAAATAPADTPAIEIGSYRGGSARFIADALAAHGTSVELYVCDTFAGHAEVDPEIDRTHKASSARWDEASAEEVARYLADRPGVEVVAGDIVETSRSLPDRPYGFVHVDVNVYPATSFCLRHFGVRLAPGATLVLDDYGHTTCPGVKRAADEFIAEFPEFRLWHLLTGQAIISRHA